MAHSTACTMPPTETYLAARSAASAASCPTGHACPVSQPTSASIARSHASPPCRAASSQPGQDRRQGRSVDANRGAIRRLNQHRLAAVPGAESASRASSSSGDSRASRTAPSSTTPAAPAATHPAATRGPIPPRTQTGRSVRARIAWRRMKAESDRPARPPRFPRRSGHRSRPRAQSRPRLPSVDLAQHSADPWPGSEHGHF